MGRPQRESNKVTKTLSDRLSDLMEGEKRRTGLKQEEICKKIGVASSSYSDWASDQKTPNVDKVALIANYFKVSVDWLLGLPGGTKTRDSNIKNAVLYTGLSECAVKALHSLMGANRSNNIDCSVIHGFIDMLLSHEESDAFIKDTLRAISARIQEHKVAIDFDSVNGMNLPEYLEWQARQRENELNEDKEIDRSITSGGLISIPIGVAASLFEGRAVSFLGDVFEEYVGEIIWESIRKK